MSPCRTLRSAAILAAATVSVTAAPAAAEPGKIAYLKDWTQIVTVNADGTGERNLTALSGVEAKSPAWSPDGTQIAVTSTTHDQLGVFSADGSYEPLNTGHMSGQYADPAWSPDGTKLAFVRRANISDPYEVWVMPVGFNAFMVTTLGTESAMDAVHPTWSPDGSEIAFSLGGGSIWKTSAEGGGTPAKVADGFFGMATQPDWGKDGRIAFSGVDELGGMNVLWTVSPDGTGLSQATFGPGDAEPSWSSDGRALALRTYDWNNGGDGDVALATPGAPGLTPVAATAGSWETDPDYVGDAPAGGGPTPPSDPAAMLAALNDAVSALNIAAGPKRALLAKLTAADCGALGAFVNQLAAISGKRIAPGDATEFTRQAEAIRAALAC